MANDITLTSSMRSNLLNLQKTQALFDMTQNRLSTGKKVNSALDNPSSFFSAQSLTKRSDALQSLLDGMGQAVQSLTAATQSIETIQSYVDQAEALANTARDTSNTATYKLGTANLNSMGAPTELGGVLQDMQFSLRIGDGNQIVGTKNMTMTQTMSDLGMAADSSAVLAIKVGDNSFVKVTFTADDTIEAVTKKINDDTRLSGLVTASLDANGRFQLVSNDSKNAITIQNFGVDGTAVDHATGGMDAMSQVLGLDAGKTVTVKAAGKAEIVGNPFGGAPADKIGTIGVSPTPALIRVHVGDNTTDIKLTEDTTLASAAVLIGNVVGIDSATYSANAGFTITGAAGKAIRIEDLDGTNFASFTGIQTESFIRPTTGGIDDLVEQINATSTDINASVDKNGYLRIEVTNGEQVTITDIFDNENGGIGKLASALGISGLSDNGTNARAGNARDFNEIIDTIDQLVQNADTSYKGINLLNGDSLVVNFNEARTSNLMIQGSVLDSKGIGMNLARNEWKTNEDIDRALADIDTATARLESTASSFSQKLNIITTREEFTDNMINTLTTGADKLTLADMNEEAANLLALQIRQQLATNALSLASQSQQSVLGLF